MDLRLRLLGRAVKSALDVFAAVLVIIVGTLALWRSLHSTRTPVAAREARPAPPLPTEPVSLDGAALKGSSSANIAIIEYSDFQCPYCAKFVRDTFPLLNRRYIETGKVLFAFRHLPLDNIHSLAHRAAENAECARQQGKFWEMHDALSRIRPRFVWASSICSSSL
jgi:protein-disulfide isomerase